MPLVSGPYGPTVREDTDPSALVTVTVNAEAAGRHPGLEAGQVGADSVVHRSGHPHHNRLSHATGTGMVR
jgi:hypothetical protein